MEKNNTDNNIDLGGLSMDKLFENFNVSKVTLNSPTQKINLDQENNKFRIAGMKLLLSYDHVDDIMHADLKDLKDDTILFINSHHIVECLLIIDGAVSLLLNNLADNDDTLKILDSNKNKNINVMLFKIGNGIIRYSVLKRIMTDFVDNTKLIDSSIKIDDNKKKVLDAFFECLYKICINVWFLPYAEIDNIIDEAVSEAEKEMNNGKDKETE